MKNEDRVSLIYLVALVVALAGLLAVVKVTADREVARNLGRIAAAAEAGCK